MATREFEIGSFDGAPELRIHRFIPQTRWTQHKVFVTITLPDDVAEQGWNDAKDCAIAAGVALGIAAIFSAGAGAIPSFWATFGGCMAAKGINLTSDAINLRFETKHGSWG